MTLSRDRTSAFPMRVVYSLAILYATVVALATLWAWWTDITLLDSGREHLLPDILLVALTFPTSLSIPALTDTWPDLFLRPLAQLSWMTFCGALQATLVLLSTRALRSWLVRRDDSMPVGRER